MEIEWSRFNGEKFQVLGNVLVHYEVSRGAHLFSKAGKDRGVDQKYEGTYDGKTGAWRFQDKFHNTGDPKKELSAYKSDIKTDIIDNCKHEDYLVYIFNGKFGPQQLDELHEVAKKALEEKGVTCEVIIWYHDIIQAIVTKYPCIFYAFWGKASIMFQEPKEAFKRDLRAEHKQNYFSLANSYFANADYFDTITAFLTSPNANTLILEAEGGYGKTRLCLEYFEQVIGKGNDWHPLVLITNGFNPNDFSHALDTIRPLLILIDDAHRDPDTVAEVTRQITQQEKHKLILTTRKSLAGVLKRTIDTNKWTQTISLEPMPYEDRKAMVKRELPGLQDEFVILLARQSQGIPLVLLDLIRAIRSGNQPSDLAGESTFQDRVLRIIDDAVTDIARQTHLPEIAGKELLKAISLLSPFSEDKDSLGLLRVLIDMEEDKIELLINAAVETGIVRRHWGLSIKPDAYSDVLVLDTLGRNSLFVKKISDYNLEERYLLNLITNIASTATQDARIEAVVNREIDNFIAPILQGEQFSRYLPILDFGRKVVYRRPIVGLRIVQALINQLILKKDGRTKEEYNSSYYESKLLEQAVEILAILANNVSYNENVGHAVVFNLILKFWSTTKSEAVIGRCYRYSKFDVDRRLTSNIASRQTFVTTKLIEILSLNNNKDHQIFAVECAKVLLSLDLQTSDYFESHTGQLHYTSGNVPNLPEIRMNRIKIKDALEQFLEKLDPTDELFSPVVGLLLDGLWFCFEGSNRIRDDFPEDALKAISYWKDKLQTSPSPNLRARVWEKIKRYNFGKTKDKYKHDVEILIDLCNQSKSNFDSLHAILLKKEHFFLRNNFPNELSGIIDGYDSTAQFLEDFIKIRYSNNTQWESVDMFYKTLANKYQDLARQLLTRLIAEDRQIGEAVYLFGATEDNGYLYGVVDDLWKRSSAENIGTILDILTNGRRNDSKLYAAGDLQYFRYVVETDKSNLYALISYKLQGYMEISTSVVFELFDQILSKKEPSFDPEMLFFSLLNDKARARKFKHQIYNLAVNHIDQLNREGYGTKFLTDFIYQEFDEEQAVLFAKKMARSKQASSRFGLIAEQNSVYPLKGVPEIEALSIFIRRINDYLVATSEDEAEVELSVAMSFVPPGGLSDVLQEQLSTIIQMNKGNELILYRLAKVIRSFNDYQEKFRLLADISHLLYLRDITFSNFEPVFGMDFIANFGSRSKSQWGVGMDEDYRKKDMLEAVIAENGYNDALVQFLKQCLNTVEQSIEDTIREDREERSR